MVTDSCGGFLRNARGQDFVDNSSQLSLVSNNIFMSCRIMLIKDVLPLDLIPFCF
jgi:hypothetical protein